MPTIKEFNIKLKSLKNTEKMTRTMKLVSMSKFYKAQEAQKKAKVYAQKLTDLIKRLSFTVEATSHPLLMNRIQVNNVLMLLLTSDKGLCGAYNNNLIRYVSAWMEENKPHFQNIYFSFCGKRGFMYFKKFAKVAHYYEKVTVKPNFSDATRIGKDLTAGFLSGQYDEVYCAHNIYHSPFSQSPTLEKILPIEAKPLTEGGHKIPPIYIFEPKEEEVLQFLIPKYLYFRIYFSLLENSAGEHGARMTAMDNATNSAEELIDFYTLLKNRARQASITKELIEIISGAEALKQ